MIQFTVPAIPVAQPRQRHRIAGKGPKQFVQNYTPTNSPVNSFKAACQMAAAAVYQGPPLATPLIVRLVLVMPRTTAQIWKTRPMPRIPHVKKPDSDNLYKSLADALEGTLFVNDSQICDLKIEKWIASGDEQPHVEVCIWQWSEIRGPNVESELHADLR